MSMKRLAVALALIALPAQAQTSDPSFVYSLGNVVAATNAAGNFGDLLWCWGNKDLPDDPHAVALSSACENLCDDLAVVLSGFGWTDLPHCPPGSGGIPVLEYVGSYRLAYRKGWEYAGSLQLGLVLQCGRQIGLRGSQGRRQSADYAYQQRNQERSDEHAPVRGCYGSANDGGIRAKVLAPQAIAHDDRIHELGRSSPGSSTRPTAALTPRT